MEDRLQKLLGGTNNGVLTTIKRDGRPQLSNVNFTYADGMIRISVTDGRAKTANLRRDPRASFYVTTGDFGSYAVAEGTATLTPVATDPTDATVEELIDVYRAISGEHPDWDEYRAAMVTDRRMVLRLAVSRIYGA
ncbi:MAG TPA: PPOX class F420-dependent oxidoreductase [Actinophytocola sp.]|nr:PPOX class F420-dependent oxidoreductase [Actinophytocola sp.]